MSAEVWIWLTVVCILTAVSLSVDLRRWRRGGHSHHSPEREVQRLREQAIRRFYEAEAAAGTPPQARPQPPHPG